MAQNYESALPVETAAAVDGRTARRDRNLELALDAVRELFAEGKLFPSIDAVARRSGVSVRSLYRYFEDPEALISAAIDRSMRIGLKNAVIHNFAKGPFDQRLTNFTASRVLLFEAHGAGFRAARHLSPNAPKLRDALENTRSFLRQQVEGQFAAEYKTLSPHERPVALAACDVVSQFDSIDYMRREQKLSTKACEKVLARSITGSLRQFS